MNVNKHQWASSW